MHSVKLCTPDVMCVYLTNNIKLMNCIKCTYYKKEKKRNEIVQKSKSLSDDEHRLEHLFSIIT